MVLLLSNDLSAQKIASTTGNSLAQKNLMAFASSPVEIKSKDEVAAAFHVRAVKDFQKQFKEIENANWYKSGNTTVASFSKNSVQTRVVYLQNGSFLRSILNYNATRLNEAIKALMAANFKNYTITWVAEVRERDQVFYFINIETTKKFKQVFVCGDELTMYKDFNKNN